VWSTGQGAGGLKLETSEGFWKAVGDNSRETRPGTLQYDGHGLGTVASEHRMRLT
jgi:hypothetical protein